MKNAPKKPMYSWSTSSTVKSDSASRSAAAVIIAFVVSLKKNGACASRSRCAHCNTRSRPSRRAGHARRPRSLALDHRSARRTCAFAPMIARVVLALLSLSAIAWPASPKQPLRVCADPNNLPFSNERRAGFENRIALLLARDMGTTVQFSWRPQMRGFVRKGLKAGACDVYMGVPAGFGPLLTTKPYYRSTYVIVYRTKSPVHVHSLDDSTLHSLKVGVH